MYQVYHLDGETKYAVDDLPLVRALTRRFDEQSANARERRG